MRLKQLTRSLSFRLFAIFVLLASSFIYFSTVGIRWVYQEDELRELISGHLSLHVDYVRADIGDPPRIENAVAITEKVPVDIRISGAEIDWASDPNFPDISELEFGDSDLFSEEPDALLNRLRDVEFATLGDHRFLKLTQDGFDIVVSSPRIADSAERPDLLRIILAIGLVFLTVAYFCVSWLFKPIDAIRDGAARIGRGELAHRITDNRRDELGDLATDINRLAGEVARMLDAKRQLLLGISHELRSPLSRLRLGAELAGDDKTKDDLLDEIREMEQIIGTLLEAERLNERHAVLNRSTVNVAAFMQQLIDDYFDRDRDNINVSIDDGVYDVRVDESRLILLLKNLLSNALRYSSADDGPVTVRIMHADSDGGSAALRIEVEDCGPGLSREQREHIGEPFFRGDPSRTRETGGTGLGLYLSLLVAEAHGGSLKLDQEYTNGARFIVLLPLPSAADEH